MPPPCYFFVTSFSIFSVSSLAFFFHLHQTPLLEKGNPVTEYLIIAVLKLFRVHSGIDLSKCTFTVLRHFFRCLGILPGCFLSSIHFPLTSDLIFLQYLFLFLPCKSRISHIPQKLLQQILLIAGQPFFFHALRCPAKQGMGDMFQFRSASSSNLLC